MKNNNKPKEFDNSWLGNMNVGELAKLFKDGKIVGLCLDTPNAIAFGMAETGATFAKSKFVSKNATDQDMINRIANKGWVTKEKALFKKL